MPRVVFFFEFLFFSAVSSRFSSNFYSLLGMDDEQTGAILGTKPLVGILSVPFWVWFADTRHSHRFTTILTASISAVLFLALVLVEIGVVPQTHAFGYFLVMQILTSLVFQATYPLVDTLTLAYFPAERQNEYGGERLWGALGWAFGHLLIGLLMDSFGATVFFVLDAITIVLFVVSCMYVLPAQSDGNPPTAQHTEVGRAVAHRRRKKVKKKRSKTRGKRDGEIPLQQNVAIVVTVEEQAASLPSYALTDDDDNNEGQFARPTTIARPPASLYACPHSSDDEDSDSPAMASLRRPAARTTTTTTTTKKTPARPLEVGQEDSIGEYCRKVKSVLCRNIVSVAFFVDVFAFGVAFSFVELLVFLFFVDDLNASYVCLIVIVVWWVRMEGTTT